VSPEEESDEHNARSNPYFTEKCPFTPKPKAKAPIKWVEPRFVCEVTFQEWTTEGKMRTPSFLGLRDE
jgi:bifunctional non-homologous end joining protein LigD